MKIDLFPVSIYHYHVAESEFIHQRVLDFYTKSESRQTPEGWNCNLFTTFGTGDFGIGEIFNSIRPCLDEFMLENNFEGSCAFTDAWLNCYDTINWQEKHSHLPGQWSAIYYAILEPGEHQGTIFYDPNEDLRMAVSKQLHNTVTSVVQEGDLILFPSWLHHAAPVNQSSYMRATISFNMEI